MKSIASSLKKRRLLKAMGVDGPARKLLEHIIPESLFYQRRYFMLHERLCNFRKPRCFSEKIFHRMRYPAPIFSILADKVRSREYIERIVGAQYLVPCYLICDKVERETFERLPDSFVMKANHSSHQTRIIVDKSQEDPEELIRTADAWLKKDFSKIAREKHYGRIRPKILFEKALLSNGKPPDDYKFNVFNGASDSQPYVFIQVMQGRFEKKMTQNLFLEDWSIAPFNRARAQKEPSHDPPLFAEPKELPEMLDIAKRLSAPFGYLRVDCYRHEGKIYVGELTITPAAGDYRFLPPEWDLILGSKFGWPERPPQPEQLGIASL